jgi:ABC-2 type transport system permease protein
VSAPTIVPRQIEGADGSPELAGGFPPARLLHWSVRRELWENRLVTLAPLVVACFVFLGTLGAVLSTAPEAAREMATAGSAASEAWSAFLRPLRIAPAPIMLVAFVAGLFYSLDALYGERRDRSILFWKSLPVSDLVTVLAKASVPLVVLPLVALALSWIVVAILTLAGSAALLAHGASAARLWSAERLIEAPIIMAYGLAGHALWFAPIYAWLLLVSSWARRLPLLWAALPWIALLAVEAVSSNSRHVAGFLGWRVTGAMSTAFRDEATRGEVDRLRQIDPIGFLATPGLWFGLVLAALFLAGAVRLRRRHEPD